MVADTANIFKGSGKDILGVVGDFSTVASLVFAIMPDPVGETNEKWDKFIAVYVEDRDGNTSGNIKDIKMHYEKDYITEDYAHNYGLYIEFGVWFKIT